MRRSRPKPLQRRIVGTLLISLMLTGSLTPVGAGTLARQVSLHQLRLGGSIAPQRNLSFAKVQAVMANGRLLLGWADAHGDTHLTPLNQALQPQGADLLIKGLMLENLHAAPDGTLLMLASRAENTVYWRKLGLTLNDALYLLRLDARGKRLFQTRLSGGKGLESGLAQFDPRDLPVLADNGRFFGAYFTIVNNWAHPGQPESIHAGDQFMLIDRQGQRQPATLLFGATSRSDHPQLLVGPRQHFLTAVLTQQSQLPPGLQLFDRNGAAPSYRMVWPGGPQLARLRHDFPPDGSRANIGLLGNLLSWQGRLMLTVSTPLPGKADAHTPKDVLLLTLGPTGNLLSESYLTRTPSLDEGRAFVFALGQRLLACWADPLHPGRTMMELLDAQGKKLQGPESVPVPFAANPTATTLPNGDLLWAWIPPTQAPVKTISLIRIKAGA